MCRKAYSYGEFLGEDHSKHHKHTPNMVEKTTRGHIYIDILCFYDIISLTQEGRDGGGIFLGGGGNAQPSGNVIGLSVFAAMGVSAGGMRASLLSTNFSILNILTSRSVGGGILRRGDPPCLYRGAHADEKEGGRDQGYPSQYVWLSQI